MAHKTDDELSEILATALARGPLVGRRYRHYKSGGLYRVECIVLDEETCEPLVVYRSAESGMPWSRTLDSWEKPVFDAGSDRPGQRYIPVE